MGAEGMHLAASREDDDRHLRTRPVVAVIDDDQPTRASTSDLLRGERYRVLSFASGDDFIHASLPDDLACILLDLFMPGRSGLDVLRELSARQASPPTLILSGQGSLDIAVEAMKLGAVDFIQKPCPPTTLLRAVSELTTRHEQARELLIADREMRLLMEALSRRQRQVLDCIVRGLPNKLIAHELRLSVRTIESYRADLLRRLGVRSIAEAVRIALAGGLEMP